MKKPALFFFFGLLFCSAPMVRAEPKFVVSDKNIVIEAGAMGNFGVVAPLLNTAKGEEKPVYTRKDPQSGTFQYASGLQLNCSAKDGQVDFQFVKATPEAKSFKFSILIPLKFNQGGSYAFDAADLKPLPVEKGGQFVQHGNARSFTVVDPVGQGFVIHTPGGYQGLQDNRTFGWAVFGYQYQYDIHGKSEGSFSIKVAPYAGAVAAGGTARPAAPKFIADRFGQSALKDFSGKVKAEEELKADGVREASETASVQADPNLDRYGGLAGSGATYGLKKTGFFHVETVRDRKVLVTPEGNLFFHLGMCGIASTDDYTKVSGREHIYEWLPKPGGEFDTAWRDKNPGSGNFSFYIANWIRKFGRPFTLEEWTGQAVRRLRSWGFNSAGAFSANTETMKAMNFPTVSFLPLGKGDGIQTLPDKIGAAEVMDPFVPGTEEALDARFRKGVAANAGNPLLIGYFLGNEQHFEILPRLIPTYQASKVAAKGRLVEMLREKYKDIAKFNTAWNPAAPFPDFEALKDAPLFVRTDAAAADMAEFYRLYLETYYSMVERVFRKNDPHHLLIGSRWTPGTANNKDVVEIGSRHLDVISINYYTYGIEESFLNKVNGWSGGKPMIFSEWHYCSAEHGLGARMEMKNDRERGEAFRNYVEQSAALPFVVGTEWFIYTDQALTGRFFEGFNGEGYNTGLVDVADRPYKELVEAATKSHSRIYDVMMGKEKAFALADPRFSGKGGGPTRRTVQASKALPGMKLDGSTTNWPGRPAEPISSDRLVMGLPNPNLRGDYRVSWDEQNLYFHIMVKDPTPLKNNKTGKNLWSADGVELFIGAKDLDRGGSMTFSDRQILFGASDPAKVHVADHEEESALCKALVVKDVTGDGYVLLAIIPWKILGVEAKPGMELLFDVMIDNSDDGEARLHQLSWTGKKGNSGDRSDWGRLRILEN